MSDAPSQVLYVAAPYGHADPSVIQDRMGQVNAFIGNLLAQGYGVVSPLLYVPLLAGNPALGSNWAFWKDIGESLLLKADAVALLELPGWEESEGVQGELVLARAMGKPIMHYQATAFAQKATVIAI